MKEKVCISQRPLKDGVISLFLDYRFNGSRRRENLKLYIHPERTPLDKARNAETMRIAKAERDRKAFELEQIEAGLIVKARPKALKFKEFAFSVVNGYHNQRTQMNALSSIRHALAVDEEIYIQEMGKDFFVSMIKYLEEKGNNANSIIKHVKRIIAIIKQAKYEGFVSDVPHVGKILPHAEPTIREFLTIEELRLLDTKPTEREIIKQAFMFSCFTGLRYIDICNLKSTMIREGNITIRQQKTAEPVRIPITENAEKYMPEGWKDRLFVFQDLPGLSIINYSLKKWAFFAGVKKRLHFHIARHTFATLVLSNGADIYLTSRLLGHTSVKTTEAYAHLVDEARRKAVGSIPKI